MLCDTARCLRGDVLWDRHCLHGLERRRVRSGEAAAHALVDRTVPRENTVLSQCALLTAHWRKMIQVLQAESKDYWSQTACETVPVTLEIWDWKHSVQSLWIERNKRLDAFIVSGMIWGESAQHTCIISKSYCLISQCWGKNQLHKEKKTREEETVQLTSLSPLWLQQLPNNRETKENGQS